ncbi:MAG: aldehyde dehydrogenase family protein [Actinobacteria bacterium]|nr:aldehyde dehydrogenase family protein [Actinomycetota bacterium]
MRTTGAREETVSVARTVASIVGGRTLEDAPGGRVSSTNPARTGEAVAEVLLGDAGTFVEACRAAREAQAEWAAVPAPIRAQVIKKIGRIVESNKEALARLVTREIGKPYTESLGEVQEIVDTCDFFTGEGRRLYGQTVPSEMPDKQLFTFRMPVGVAAIITAGNFPVAVPSWYLTPAIVCGNAVVWKPAEYAPAIGDALAQLFLRGGLPDGVLNVVQAEGDVAFEGLTEALDAGLVDKVGFTGSSEVGRRIGELCDTVHGSTGTGRITADNPRENFVGDPEAGLYCHPTIIDGVTADDELYRIETFGPIVSIAAFADFDEAVALANGHGYGLSAAIYTRDAANALRFRERSTAGMISVNNSTSGAEAHLPFGGNGKSGNGSRLSGIWVLDQFTRWQAVNWDYAGKLQKAQMDIANLPADLDYRLED